MDKLLNEFTVNRPIDETWAVLTDVERIAPCMPGAQLEEIEGDVYRGVVKVKLGAIATAFKGQASSSSATTPDHRAVLHGEGRDTTGKGNADALITATLDSMEDDETTRCIVETDLRITGKVAQFGRGIMGDVSKKLIAQFATNLNTMLDEGRGTPAAADGSTARRRPGRRSGGRRRSAPSPRESPGAAVRPRPAPTGAAGPETKKPTVRKIDGPATSRSSCRTSPVARS